MTIITMANLKGGVGKTTTTINLAYAFQRMGLRVVVVDHDSQGNATSGFGVSTEDETRTLYEALLDMKGLPLYEVGSGIFLCPSDIRLASIETDLHGVKGRTKRLRILLEQIAPMYDVAIIDCPPNHAVGTNSALLAADEVLVPLEASLFSVRGLQKMLETVDTAKEFNPRLHLLGLLINRYRHTSVHDFVVAELRENYPSLVLDTIIRESVSISAAQLNRSDVVQTASRSIGAADYDSLGKEITVRLKSK